MTTDEELLERWPAVRLDADNAAYYAGLLRREIVLHRCGGCGWWHHPPRPLCPRCWSWAIVPTPIAGQGTVALSTRRGAPPGKPAPRPVVAVELVEQPGLRISGEFAGAELDEVAPGTPVTLGWEERDGRPAPVWFP
jgi:uncharacterized OB-fold protein